MKRITIIGAGMMGSAMSIPARDNGREVHLVGTPLDDAIIAHARETHTHLTMQRPLPEGVAFYRFDEVRTALAGADVVICGVSSFGVDWFLQEALPLIRYRTHDVGYIIPEPCKCGRTHARISKLLGRTDDMLIIRGVNVFPSQIESVLTSLEGIAPHYQLLVDRVNNRDSLTVLVEMTEENFTDEVRKIEAMAVKVRREIENVLGISVDVRLVAPKTITRFEGKAVRIIDKRKLRE